LQSASPELLVALAISRAASGIYEVPDKNGCGCIGMRTLLGGSAQVTELAEGEHRTVSGAAKLTVAPYCLLVPVLSADIAAISSTIAAVGLARAQSIWIPDLLVSDLADQSSK
jgi:hypothetical protein